MNPASLPDSFGRCGLACTLCQAPEVCSCRGNNHCGKRLSPAGCFQYDCSREKGLEGCWECPDAPCDKDMHAPGKAKVRAFVRCMREDGLARFLGYLERNAENGVVYHRDGIFGDYDLETEDEILLLLRG